MGFKTFSAGFFETLKETFKIFFRNGKLIPSIALLKITVNSILMLSYLLAIKLYLKDYAAKQTDLLLQLMNDTTNSLTNGNDSVNATEPTKAYLSHVMALMKLELIRFVFAYLAFAVSFAFSSLIFAIAAITASSESFLGRQLRAKELVSMTIKSFRRAIVTLAYTTLLGLGYAFIAFAFVVLPIEIVSFDPNNFTGKLSPFATIAFVPTMILYFYLNVVWTLALVVSVLEEKRGFEALWKASEISKGLRLKGFLLMLLFGGLVSSLVVFSQVSTTKSLGQKEYLQTLMRLNVFPFILLVFVSTLIGMFSLISFTVLYFEGKKIHGDEVIEMKGYSVEYAKIVDSASLTSSDIP